MSKRTVTGSLLFGLWAVVVLQARADYIVQDLGTLGGTFQNVATGINSSGQVVGDSFLPGDSVVHAFLYSNGVMIDLGVLAPTNSDALGINNSGQVVGEFTASDGLFHAFLYSNGSLLDLHPYLAPLGAIESVAEGINDQGQIVGFYEFASGDRRPFLLTPTAVTIPESPSWMLVGVGLAVLGVCGWRQRRMQRIAT
jgi:probable HAF family extracellular repeat protein